MANEKEITYAFIDGNNLYWGAKEQDIIIDYGRLRKYLSDKLCVNKAFLFIGYSSSNKKLYKALKEAGFFLVYKQVVFYEKDGLKKMKGNVDAELVLHAAAIEYENYDKAVVISSDGDFACLLKFLKEKGKLKKIITPAKTYSTLLRQFADYILPLRSIAKSISLKKTGGIRGRSKP
jgi:uncharacterized LabA/DUF88 family protein